MKLATLLPSSDEFPPYIFMTWFLIKQAGNLTFIFVSNFIVPGSLPTAANTEAAILTYVQHTPMFLITDSAYMCVQSCGPQVALQYSLGWRVAHGTRFICYLFRSRPLTSYISITHSFCARHNLNASLMHFCHFVA
jgi:hypothetical protein